MDCDNFKFCHYKSVLFFTAIWLFPNLNLAQSSCDSLLAAFYPFSGNSLDKSGAGHDGTLAGNATVDGVLHIPHDAVSTLFLPKNLLDGAGDFTISCRVKFDKFQVDGDAPINVIFNGFGVNNALVVGYRKSNNILHLTFQGAGIDVEMNQQLEVGQWYCLHFTRAGDMGMVYLDGAQVGPGIAVNGAPLNLDAIALGQDMDCVSGCFAANQSLDGSIENFRVFRRALQPDEVAGFCKMSTISLAICEGEQFEGHAEPGAYLDYFTTPTACDSLRLLHLTVNPAPTVLLQKHICPNESFMGYKESGTHQIIFQTQTGCDSIVKIELTMDRNVFAPTAFSPNGDGINDAFNLMGPESDFAISSLRIFNRWGSQVFEAENTNPNEQSAGWNGTFSGKTCQTGLYTWLAFVEFNCGKQVLLSGGVTLIR